MADALLVFNRNPYDGTDVTWNGLRLAEALLNAGLEVKIFVTVHRYFHKKLAMLK